MKQEFSSNKDISTTALHVKTQQDFINFVKELSNDFTHEPATWENTTVSDFLSGIEGYCLDKTFEKLSWNHLAEILLAATVYE